MAKLTTGHDSLQELSFENYLRELKNAGFISKYQLHPETYELLEPVTYIVDRVVRKKPGPKKTTLLYGKTYTPDYKIWWSQKAKRVFCQNLSEICLERIPFLSQYDFEEGCEISVIDVKPAHFRHGMLDKFNQTQKLLFHLKGIYVQKIEVNKLYDTTFFPLNEAIKEGKKKKRVPRTTPILLLDEFLKTLS